LIQTHRENCRHLERSHAEEMERQSVWHTEESNRIRSDLELLRHKYSELRKRFDARESRPEDTRRIHDLKKLLKKQQFGVDEMQQQMEYFKMELMNREENFNKVFGRQPVVGVMDIFSGKKKEKKQRTTLPPLAEKQDMNRRSR